LAADQNLSVAQCSLGEAYENGYGVKIDLEQAGKYYKLAADQGYEPAKEKLRQLGLPTLH
jgi:TPR repeat protein